MIDAVAIEKRRPTGRPFEVELPCREVGGKRRSRGDIRVQAPLHHVGDPALIDLVVRCDSRVIVLQHPSQLDYRNHIRRDLLVSHNDNPHEPLEAGAGRCESQTVGSEIGSGARPAGWGLSADTRGREAVWG